MHLYFSLPFFPNSPISHDCTYRSYRKISLFLFFISLICVSGTKKSILSLLETILMVLYIIFVGLDTRLIFEQIVTTAIILCSLAVLIGSVYVSVEVDSVFFVRSLALHPQ